MKSKTVEKTKDLLVQYQTAPEFLKRDIEDKIYLMNRPLIYSTLKRFKIPSDKFEDFFQDAAKGMVEAIRRFNPENNVAFSTFAVNTMKGVIKNGYRDKGWMLKVSRIDKEQGVKVSLMHPSEQEELDAGELCRIQHLINAQNPVDLTEDVIYNTPDSIDHLEQKRRETTSLAVDGLLSKLNDEDQELLRLLFVEGWTPSDVSAALIMDIKDVEQSRDIAIEKCKSCVSMIDEDDFLEIFE